MVLILLWHSYAQQCHPSAQPENNFPPVFLSLLSVMPLPLLYCQILTEQLRLVAFLPPSCHLSPLFSPLFPNSSSSLSYSAHRVICPIYSSQSLPCWLLVISTLILPSLSCHTALLSSPCTYICSLSFLLTSLQFDLSIFEPRIPFSRISSTLALWSSLLYRCPHCSLSSSDLSVCSRTPLPSVSQV